MIPTVIVCVVIGIIAILGNLIYKNIQEKNEKIATNKFMNDYISQYITEILVDINNQDIISINNRDNKDLMKHSLLVNLRDYSNKFDLLNNNDLKNKLNNKCFFEVPCSPSGGQTTDGRNSTTTEFYDYYAFKYNCNEDNKIIKTCLREKSRNSTYKRFKDDNNQVYIRLEDNKLIVENDYDLKYGSVKPEYYTLRELKEGFYVIYEDNNKPKFLLIEINEDFQCKYDYSEFDIKWEE